MTTSPVNLGTDFVVSFEGQSLLEHTIEVRDFAPALLALSQTFDQANGVLNGDRATVSLRIRATTPGSFEALLYLEQIIRTAGGVLVRDLFAPADKLIRFVVGGDLGTVSLLSLLKGLQGNTPHTEEQRDGIVFEAENLRVFVPTEVARLYFDKPTRENLEEFVRPLVKDGIDRVVLSRNKVDFETVESEEAKYFRTDFENTDSEENIIPRQRLQIANAAFIRGKWRLSDGTSTRWYAIEDAEFMREIDQGKRVGKHDILICEIVMRQRTDETGTLRTDYAIRRIHNHIPPVEQPSFPDTPLG